MHQPNFTPPILYLDWFGIWASIWFRIPTHFLTSFRISDTFWTEFDTVTTRDRHYCRAYSVIFIRFRLLLLINHLKWQPFHKMWRWRYGEGWLFLWRWFLFLIAKVIILVIVIKLSISLELMIFTSHTRDLRLFWCPTKFWDRTTKKSGPTIHSTDRIRENPHQKTQTTDRNTKNPDQKSRTRSGPRTSDRKSWSSNLSGLIRSGQPWSCTPHNSIKFSQKTYQWSQRQISK